MFPVIMLNVEDFPAPFGPRRPKICPFSTPNVVPLTAWKPFSYILWIFFAFIGSLLFTLFTLYI